MKSAETDDAGISCHLSGLPIRPRPGIAESRHGYLVRVANANGYGSLTRLCAALKTTHRRTEEVILQSLNLTKDELGNLEGPWPWYFRYEDILHDGLCKADYLTELFRWCPQCLAEGPYLRAKWAVKFCVTCLTHEAYLIDSCPSCQRRQKIEHFCTRCTCGQSLSNCKSLQAPSGVLELQSALIARSRQYEALNLPRLTPSQWIRLLEKIAALTEPSHKLRTGQVAGLQNLSTSIIVVERASQFLKNWPIGFHTFLHDLQEKGAASFSLQKTFGRLYHWLYVDLHDQEFSFLREAFDAYVNEHWWGLVCRRNRRLHNNQTTRHRASIGMAAKVAGSTPTRVKQLHLAGLIEAKKVIHPSGRQSWSVPVTSVAEICVLAAHSIDLRSAAAYLALPRQRVRELISAGVIHPYLSAGKGKSSTWMLPRSELDSLVLPSLQPAPIESAPSDPVTILHALKSWRLEPGAFTALVRALNTGQITRIVQTPANTPFGKIELSIKSLREWLEHWRKEHRLSMSISDAAKILGLKEQVAYDLVEAGLLSAMMEGSGHARRISNEEITRFQATYVAATTLSKMLNTSSRGLIARTQVTPVTGPTVDGKRQYFFRRSDSELVLSQASRSTSFPPL